MQVAAKIIDSPVGALKLLATDSALIAVLWSHEQPVRLRALNPTFQVEPHPILQLAEQQLIEYFTSDRQQFTLPLAWVTGTDFQRAVWQALRRIPYGETCSYKALAEQINRPKAVRAVGAANGQNPLSIIVPCHRVIGANGALVGFAGGVDKKQFLLALEQR